ncbi:RRM motif-containing protein [Phaffia rhodozyma]|uniref:RRM motif-containing protein n=1 Tax=Phaffia rhodozyma TaxID=264483 RepID=A0A0F7SUJ4_PHARH|nr:RRM motif-containing protein [Phaffia rhodozyma]
MDIDMSLDEIITTNKKSNNRRNGRAGGRAPANGNAKPAGGAARERYAKDVPTNKNGNVQSRQQAAAARVQAQGAAAPAAGADASFHAVKIIISNLPLDVDDQAVKDLFQSTIGPTRECYLAYDKNGKHKGVATVVFSRKGDAQKAFKTYNNRLVDGRTPMKVELVFAKPPAAPLAARVATPVAPAATAPAARREGGGRAGGRGPKKSGPGAKAARSDTGRRPQKTQAELDAEMEAWSSNQNTESAA